MTDIEALKESVSEKLYAQEPLAQAILSYLNNSDPAAHQAILNRFDEIVSARIDCLIQKTDLFSNAPYSRFPFLP